MNIFFLNTTLWKTIFIVENDLKLTTEQFFSKLYFYLYNSELFSSKTINNENIKMFIRGFFETRGSIDFKLNYLSSDYFYSNRLEFNKCLIFTNYFNISLAFLNINFRQLQNDYVENKNQRNTQIRIRLDWFLKNIGIINDYKANILKTKFKYINYFEKNNITYFNFPDKNVSNSNTFLERIQFFVTYISGRDIDKNEVKKLRQELKFEDIPNESEQSKRDRALVESIIRTKSDKCSGCFQKYDINTRSFKWAKNNNYYFEVHHNIALSNDYNSLDVPDNLVKLCPICHKCLKKNVGFKCEQMEIIKSILNSEKEVKEFAFNYFGLESCKENENFLIERIWLCLK
ncbi:HNH endonuclease [Metamycoplasma orale]|uniref:HNH domain-containing protein n=1 Tax=Metamycoplasma orale TaxID=2121 RepID=A0A448ZWL5_METOS|nr:HNH endonuclease [Metamycoplasma orale]VEU55677.1 Uncharacterised protein [Metamycoplasma orale]